MKSSLKTLTRIQKFNIDEQRKLMVEQQNKEDENRPNQYGNECREKFGKARLSKRLVVISRKIVKHQPEKRDDELASEHTRILQIVK